MYTSTRMKEKFLLTLVVLILDVLSAPLLWPSSDTATPAAINHNHLASSRPDAHSVFAKPARLGGTITLANRRHNGRAYVLFAEAKGVAGLGKAGGDGTGGADKAGTQVPPEVYNALTYAGGAFLLTLSVPLILYGLNKLLNKIEDCFGCGPASKQKGKKVISERPVANQQMLFAEQANNNAKSNESSLVSGNLRQQYHNHRSLTNQLKQQQQESPQLNSSHSPQIASYPANKDSRSSGISNGHNHPGAARRQNSPAALGLDSTAITLPFDLSQQQQQEEEEVDVLKKHHTATSAFQNNYLQSDPFIMSPPHI